MMILVTGGSASGKSEFAEQLVMEQGTAKRLYLATMRVWDEEGRERVERHRLMRQEKQFQTIECYKNLAELDKRNLEGTVILLECMSNLAANEWYEEGGSSEVMLQRIINGVRHLKQHAAALIIVTNEVFSDEGNYSSEVRAYLELLGQVNQELAAMSEAVVEVVYGIPVWQKRRNVPALDVREF